MKGFVAPSPEAAMDASHVWTRVGGSGVRRVDDQQGLASGIHARKEGTMDTSRESAGSGGRDLEGVTRATKG